MSKVTKEPSAACFSGLGHGNVAERKVRLQISHRPAIRLRVRIDKVIQGIALLVGREANVAAIGEENAVGVVRTEEEVALGRILPGLGSVHWDPANPGEIKFRPAMVARDVAFRLALGQGETDFKSRGNARRTHHADEQRMEIGAVAPLGSASPDGVPAAPPLTGFVITHGGENIVVNMTSLLDGCGVTGGAFLVNLGDHAVERNNFVRVQVALEGCYGGGCSCTVVQR